jgi:phage major head subunit gpT-like protein
MPLIKNEALTEVQATVNGRYAAVLAANPADASQDVLADTGKYGSSGYVLPFLGGVPKLRKWTSGSRVVKSMREFGFRATGYVWESTAGISVVDVNDGLIADQATIGEGFALADLAHKPEALATILNANEVSLFDNQPLFGDHEFVNPDDPLDVTTYNNSIETGTGPFWYCIHSSTGAKPLVYALRTGEEGNIEFPAGSPAGSEHTFMTDEILVGLRKRVIATAGLWFLIVRSNKALNAANMQEAKNLLASFRNDRADFLNNDATHIVVPTGLVPDGDKVLKAQYVNGGDSNIYAGTLALVANKWLNATAPAPVGP